MATRADVLRVLEANGPLFSRELMAAAGVSRELLRLMQQDKQLVDLNPGPGGKDKQALWSTPAHVKRVLQGV